MAFNVIVLLSGNGSTFESIIQQVKAGTLPVTIGAVISNRPNAYGLQRAANHQVTQCVLDHTEYSSREHYDQALIQCIDQFQPDLIVLAGYMRILTPAFVQHYQGRLINIHPSLLPKYQGLHTHRRALEAGDTEHGTSVHFVTEELDGGPVIAQAKVAIAADETEQTLEAKVKQQEQILYPNVIRWIAEGKVTLNADQSVTCEQDNDSTT